MGTSRFAVPILEAIVKAGHEVVAVVTQPDRPSGRGREVHTSPVKNLAVSLNISVFQPERIKTEDSITKIKSYEPLDAIVVAAFGQIVPQAILDIPKFGSINVHASLLPKYRGAAPIHYAIMYGETVTGVTTMLMDAGLDTGDILLKREIPIGPEETTGELEPRLAEAGAELLIETLVGLEQGKIKPEPQDHEKATIAKSIKREQGQIDWTKPASDIINLVRAFSPRPGAFTFLNNVQLKVWKAQIDPVVPEGISPGRIMEITTYEIIVAAGQGAVRLIEVQPENKRRMSAGEFARGARIKLEECFINP
jgi:methionyl-tRNA formyltransferase